MFGYDYNGNTLTKTIDGYQSSYAYDAKNHLQGAQLNDTGVITSTSYRYDVDGIRIQKTEGTDSTDYLVDPNHAHAQVIRETNGSNHTDYLYGDDLIRQSQDAANERYYLYDGLGSTRKLSDSAGAITDSYDYEAFGSVLNRTGVSENNYQFTGEQYDNALDNYYLRARYYDQNVARFTQMDSWMGNSSDPLSLHKYLYSGSDPVNHVDPSGHFFSLGEVAATLNIRSIISSMQIDTGMNLLDLAIDPQNAGENFGQNSAIALGLGALGGSSFKILKMLSGKFRKACNSFEGDTGVWAEDGIRNIQDLSIGDKVWAFNEATQELELQDVVHLIQREGDYDLVSITLESGETIDTTQSHPFYVKTAASWNWKDAGELAVGDLLRDKDGSDQLISSVDIRAFQGKVYNLTVNKDHTYLVGDIGVVAHNAGTCKVPVFNTRTTNHLRGEFNSGGAFVGYHSRFGGSDISGVRVVNIVRPPGGYKNKIYGGTVQVLKNGEWVNKKGGFSTFWPDGWNLQKIRKEVNAVYNTATTKGFSGSGTITANGPSGFKVLIQAEGGVIVRTHPVF